MALTRLGDLPVNTVGNLPVTGEPAPSFSLTGADLNEIGIEHFVGRSLILNVFPSIETRVCALSVREFNRQAALLDNVSVCAVSMDLPFAFSRFCSAEGIKNVIALSAFRNPEFGEMYGVRLINGPFKGLFARAVFVIDASQRLAYAELVPSIDLEPDYERALNVIKNL